MVILSSLTKAPLYYSINIISRHRRLHPNMVLCLEDLKICERKATIIVIIKSRQMSCCLHFSRPKVTISPMASPGEEPVGMSIGMKTPMEVYQGADPGKNLWKKTKTLPIEKKCVLLHRQTIKVALHYPLSSGSSSDSVRHDKPSSMARANLTSNSV